MEYIPIERSDDAFQQPVEQAQLMAMCRRTFGKDSQIERAKELDGGLYNNTYLVSIVGMQPIILRVSPHRTRQFRLEKNLMRNEYMSLPFLAPIAPLLPKILMVDFTHQILERDYLFQTYMEGEQWAQLMQTFTPEEQKMLWRQLGRITKKIHAVSGDHFGNDAFGSHFASWSLTVRDWLMTIIRDLEDVGLDTTDIRSLLNQTQAHSKHLDEITRPQFLHGDLWTVNILVKHGEEGPTISAVLDSDRTSWGDPMADWTMFLLHRYAGTEVDAFWETYGQPEKSLGAQVRRLIYQGRYLGGARLEHHRLHHHEAVRRSYQDMQMILEELSTTVPLNPLGNWRRKVRCMRGTLREQNLENPLPDPFFAPATIMVHDGFPRPETLRELTPGARRVGHPEHGFHTPASLLCGAAALGLRRLEQRAQLLPQGIGELRQPRQTHRRRPHVRRCNRGGLASAALQVAPIRSVLMGTAKAGPPHELRALLLCHLDPSDQSADFCDAELETGRLVRTFFSRAL